MCRGGLLNSLDKNAVTLHGVMVSRITSISTVQWFVQANNKEYIKAPYLWSFVRGNHCSPWARVKFSFTWRDKGAPIFQLAGKNLYFAFVDLEKAFDRVPRQVIWWAMRKLGVQEWLIRWVQSLYRGARSSVRIGDTYSEEFHVKVGVHQGSVLSPLLFIMVLEALSREFLTGCPCELFYADDLVIMSKTLNELLEKLKTWKKGMEAKGLKANMTKTKLMISGPELNLLRDSGKYPCAVCRKRVGSNAIYCTGCAHWVHKRCSGIKDSLANRTDFQCKRCKGIARPIDGRPTTSIAVEESELGVVYEFCYLGDMIDAGGGCERTSI